MGKYKILYYPLAKQDLEEIYLYIAEQMPRAALGVIDKITSIIEGLGDYPYRYKLVCNRYLYADAKRRP